jgi:hypothetical protein
MQATRGAGRARGKLGQLNARLPIGAYDSTTGQGLNQSIRATRLRCACLIYYMRMMVSPAFDSARRSQLYGYNTRLSLERSSTIPGQLYSIL